MIILKVPASKYKGNVLRNALILLQVKEVKCISLKVTAMRITIALRSSQSVPNNTQSVHMFFVATAIYLSDGYIHT